METDLLQLLLEPVELDSSFKLLIPGVEREREGTGNFSSLLDKPEQALNGINVRAAVLPIPAWNASSFPY